MVAWPYTPGQHITAVGVDPVPHCRQEAEKGKIGNLLVQDIIL